MKIPHTIILILIVACLSGCVSNPVADKKSSNKPIANVNVPTAEQLLEIKGCKFADPKVQEFIKQFSLRLYQRTKTEDTMFYPEGESFSKIIEEVYDARGSYVRIITSESKGRKQSVKSLVVSFWNRLTIDQKNRLLPYGLNMNDTPDSVTDKFGRPEADFIDKNGNGYIDYFAGVSSIIPIKVYFTKNKIEGFVLY